MPANYNLSAFNNQSVNVTTYFQFANSATQNVFGALVALAFFVIVFVSLKDFGNRPALAAASSLTTVFCLLGNSGGIIADQIMWFSFILTSGVAVYLYIDRQ